MKSTTPEAALSYLTDHQDSDSPFTMALKYVLATGDRPESMLSLTELDEHLMITYNILSRPAYADDRQIQAWQHELELAITRVTCNLEN